MYELGKSLVEALVRSGQKADINVNNRGAGGRARQATSNRPDARAQRIFLFFPLKKNANGLSALCSSALPVSLSTRIIKPFLLCPFENSNTMPTTTMPASLRTYLALQFLAAVAWGARPSFPTHEFEEFQSQNNNDSNANDNNDNDKNARYKKYAAYPPYCSTPDEMEKRAVPPLKKGDGPPRGEGTSEESRLVHVTALIRHGARTPYAAAPYYVCWDGYWDDPETGSWDCELKTYVSPPAASKEREVVDGAGGLIEEVSLCFI